MTALRASTWTVAALAATWLACGRPTPAAADIRINGDLKAMQLTANGDSLVDVLSRFDALFAVKCRSAVPLEAEVRGTYSGSLSRIVARLLDGYNYVIRNDRELTEILVFGRAGETPVAPKARPAATAAPAKTVTSRWR